MGKPWRDEDRLRELVEETSKTQKEIAEDFGCSPSTIYKWSKKFDLDTSRGYLPYEKIAMFSGGHDSLVSTHFSMEQRDCDAVLHIDTGTGIDKNQEFVEEVCEQYDWPLEIVTPNITLEEFAKKYGFPKAQAHNWIYRYLKEHPLASFTTDLKCDKPEFFTGVRRDESERRARMITAERQERERWVWVAPLADWTDEDCEEYIDKHNLPRNPVVETIGRSGECFCGAYADRWQELLALQEEYPEHADWILEVEQEVQGEIGTDEDYCYWGSSGMTSDELEELMEGECDMDMMMCVDCEGEGHRNLDWSPTTEDGEANV